jgi:hypothetical protein
MMSAAFTDDDVILGTQAAIAHYKAERGITGNTYMWEGMEPQVSAVLAAVAPAIAARALREAAKSTIAYCDKHNADGEGALEADCDWCAALGVDQEWVERLTERARAIERTP